eukprot:6201034-Pleurochrysis_carterae.AAC.2
MFELRCLECAAHDGCYTRLCRSYRPLPMRICALDLYSIPSDAHGPDPDHRARGARSHAWLDGLRTAQRGRAGAGAERRFYVTCPQKAES